jgi:hypothetical protein
LLRSFGAQRWVAFCERSREIVSDLSSERPFFEQVRVDDIYDVVAVRNSTEAQSRGNALFKAHASSSMG